MDTKFAPTLLKAQQSLLDCLRFADFLRAGLDQNSVPTTSVGLWISGDRFWVAGGWTELAKEAPGVSLVPRSNPRHPTPV